MVSIVRLAWLESRLRANQHFLGRALTQCRSKDPAVRLLGIVHADKFNKAVAFWRRKIKEAAAN